MPWGVFAINVSGSFLLGLVLGHNQKSGLSQSMMFFLATGLLGAFTTFSAFSWDNLQLWERGSYGLLGASVVGQLALGMMGLWLGRSLLS
jgi:CrcB protein